MKIDIEIEPEGDVEDARDLPVRIAIGVRTAANQIGATFTSRDQQLIGAGIVE